jgi:hypothetical protein
MHQPIFSKIVDNGGGTVTVDTLELLNLLSSELMLFEQYWGKEYPEALKMRYKMLQKLASILPEYKEG